MGVFKLEKGDARRSGKLAPCPFCNNDATFINYRGGFLVKCPVCDCMKALQISVVYGTIVPFKTEEDAIKSWNKRLGVMEHGRALMPDGTTVGILAARDKRARLIIDCFERRKGEVLHCKSIAEDTGIKSSVVNNTMNYVKKICPNIVSLKNHGGYAWKE